MSSDSNFIIQRSSFSIPTRRVVLLGASNLTRGISTVVETARKIWGQPLEIFAAVGHGRSYGMESSLLGRRLPGIVQCGLWDELGSRPSLPTAALVTDIGNDILYGVEVPEIVKWIETALDRLSATGVSICMTGLPLAGIAELSPGRFKFFSKLFFPNCRLTLDDARRRAGQLQEAASVACQGEECSTYRAARRLVRAGSDPYPPSALANRMAGDSFGLECGRKLQAAADSWFVGSMALFAVAPAASTHFFWHPAAPRPARLTLS